jgi:hypothetical protein
VSRSIQPAKAAAFIKSCSAKSKSFQRLPSGV